MQQTEALVDKIITLPESLLELPQHPIVARNVLSTHPLFQPERIKRLLRALPRDCVEIRSVKVVGSGVEGYKRGDLLREADPVDTFERLEEKPAWMLLHKTWVHDADYKELLNNYLQDLQSQSTETKDGVEPTGCWMFLSSGNIVVHFHADPDQSFLNQIRGSKNVFVYPARIVPEAAIEEMVYKDDQGSVTYNPDYEQHMFSPVRLDPGTSVFLPLYAPHRVVNDSELSISWNVGFHTRHSRKRDHVHRVNWELRQMGIQPAAYRASALGDTVKSKMLLPFRIKNKLTRILSSR